MAMDKAEQVRRLAAVRAIMADQGIDAFIVPRADQHQGEYVPACAERLAWLTGFTGSAGCAVITASRAAVFIDGRYTLQVTVETDGDLYEFCSLTENPPAQWLAGALGAGQVLGYDPWLHTSEAVRRYTRALTAVAGSLRALENNPVDVAWSDRPAAPMAPVVPHEDAFSGVSAAAKRARIGGDLVAAGIDAAVLSAPESLAWLLNLRGGDVPFTPLPLGFGILAQDGTVSLYMEAEKITPAAMMHLGTSVRLAPPADFVRGLDALTGKVIAVDTATGAAAIADRLKAAGAEVRLCEDPTALPRATKNSVELAGTRAAHRRDGVALVRFLAWLDSAAARGGVTEISAADRLEAFRREGDHFKGLSFPTISGAGPNGAIVHYRVGPETDRALQPGELYLVDSGAQYLDGTTDVTRTIAIGAPTAEMRRRYTQVLQGHIAVSRAIFPKGTTGSQLDVLARLPLWADGVDYDHGTGHGVGSYLSVHEGPQRISKVGNPVALQPGMVLSNEPGYYKAGAYGIRIENLLTVSATETPPAGAEREVFAFETLTLAPYDRTLIDVSLLSATERGWVDAYHARVQAMLGAALDGETARWLQAATAPLAD